MIIFRKLFICPNHQVLFTLTIHIMSIIYKSPPWAWFQRLAKYVAQIGFHHSQCDSSQFISPQIRKRRYQSTNPFQHRRTKHIEIDIHFVSDKVATSEVRTLHVPSSLQYVDLFMKRLPIRLFTLYLYLGLVWGFVLHPTIKMQENISRYAYIFREVDSTPG